jgi:phage shock protein PspC (stress-responsive transcriptional regulator)
MKKVEKVSIANISFTLDNDAYLSLKQYLDSLHLYYDNTPDGREIIADIEARIAELILERQMYSKVVSAPLVDTIIAQLGTPDQIDKEAGDEESEAGYFGGASGSSGAFGGASTDAGIPRRMYRSSEGKIFGGVCSGIAKYFNINVLWVRLGFLVPLILSIFTSPFHMFWFSGFSDSWSAIFVITYLVLWVALPVARTPRQKLEARGERITPEAIRQNLQSSVNTPAGKKAASVVAEIVTVLGRVVLLFVKVITAIVGFSFLFSAVVIFMAMMGALFDPVPVISGGGDDILAVLQGMSILTPLWFVELLLLCIMLPLLIVGIALVAFTFNWRLTGVFFGVTLGVWAIGMIFCGIVMLSNVRFFHDVVPERIERWEERYDDDWDDWRHRREMRIRDPHENIAPIDEAEDVTFPPADSLIL